MHHPSRSDLLVVAGIINLKMAPVIISAYKSMQKPKWVMALGSCACTGGLYKDFSRGGIGQFIPVDVFVNGCPPSTDSILQGVEQIKQKINPD